LTKNCSIYNQFALDINKAGYLNERLTATLQMSTRPQQLKFIKLGKRKQAKPMSDDFLDAATQ
jgi:ribosomal protein S19E (S16A)